MVCGTPLISRKMLHIWLRFLQTVKIKRSGYLYNFQNLILRGICLHIPGFSNARKKAIQLYLEGNGFRLIERILKVSHVSVTSRIKKVSANLEKVSKKDEKVEVLELNEL
jgi:hypothetical protein